MKDQVENEILDQIIKQYETQNFGQGSYYILPDGRILDLGNTGYGHSDLALVLKEKGIEKNYKEGSASSFLRELGWVRLNTKMMFVDLKNIKPTNEQYSKLLYALDYMQRSDFQKQGIQITVKNQFKIYKDRTPEEIINLIKRYYSSGTLFESLGN